MQSKPLIFDIDPQTFQSDVVERSREVPVVLFFWTIQVAPAADTKRVLESLVNSYQGKFALAISEVSENPAVAQQLQVQAIPSIRVIRDGKLVDQLDGPQGEQALRDLLDKHTMSGNEALKSALAEVVARQDWDTAIQIIQQAINEEPNNPSYRVEWADVLVLKGDLEGARQVLDQIPADVEERNRPQIRLELLEEAAGMGTLEEARSEVATDENDLDAKYREAVLLGADGRLEEGLAAAMAILQRDRSFRDDIGRETMVRLMTLLGRESPVAKSFRRRMFSLMH